jgi:hypothetical protein
MRGRGYQAIACRISEDKGGFYIQLFRGRGTGQGPVEAVIAAYRDAIERGDPVSHGLEEILTAEKVEPLPAPGLGEIDALIGTAQAAVTTVTGINIEDLIG